MGRTSVPAVQGAVLAGASQGGQVKSCLWLVWNNEVPSLGEPASFFLLLPLLQPWLQSVQRMLGIGAPCGAPGQCICQYGPDNQHTQSMLKIRTFQKSRRKSLLHLGWGDMLGNIHSSFIPDSPTWETTHMLISREQEQTCSTVPPALCQTGETRQKGHMACVHMCLCVLLGMQVSL